MATIVTRSGKGSALSHQEMDDNFTNLNTDLVAVEATADEATKLLATVDNKTAGTLNKGTPVYITGATGNTYHVEAADASDPAKMPAAGVLAQQLAADAEGDMIIAGFINGVDTSGFSAGDEIYVAVGGGFTNSAPTGEGNLIQKLGVVSTIDASNGAGLVQGAGRTNATPNLDEDQFFLGNASNQAIATDFSDAVDARINAASIDDLSDVDTSTVAPTNGQALVWDGTALVWEPGTVSGSGISNVVEDTTPQLGGDLDVNDNDIINNGSDPFFRIGKNSNYSNSRMLNNDDLQGVALITDITPDNVNQANGIGIGSKIVFGADQGSTSDSQRIKSIYAETVLDPAGYDLTTTSSGRGVAALHTNLLLDQTDTGNASTVDYVSGYQAVIEQGNSKDGDLTITNLQGVFSGFYLPEHTVTNVYGFRHQWFGVDSNITGDHFSFYSDNNNAILRNDGPAKLGGINYPTSAGTTGQVLTTDGVGTLTFEDPTGSDVVNDTTPQLGGNLDVQDNYIFTSHASGDVQIKATTSTEPVIFKDNGNNSTEIRLLQNSSDALGTVISAYDDIQSNYGDLNFQARTIIFDGQTYPVTFRTTANGLMFNFQDENDSNASLFNIGDIKIQASRPIQFPLYTSTEIAGLTGTAAGMVVFNTSTSKLQCYDGTAWQNLH